MRILRISIIIIADIINMGVLLLNFIIIYQHHRENIIISLLCSRVMVVVDLSEFTRGAYTARLLLHSRIINIYIIEAVIMM